jgi:hypothetical protein
MGEHKVRPYFKPRTQNSEVRGQDPGTYKE